MIEDVSNALKSILDDPAIKTACKELFAAGVQFDRPGEQFKPTQSSAVDLFLYDVREDTTMRNNQPLIEHDSNGRAIIRRPPLRVACSYLVTAWVDSASDEALLQEQRLLSQTIQVLSCYPTIPTKFFPSDSALKTQEPPLPMMVTQMEGVKDPADFWSAIGGKLRPSFVVTVTVSLPVFEPSTPVGAPLVTGRRLDVGKRTSPDEKGIRPVTLTSEEIKNLFRIFGTVTGPDGAAVKGAVVTIAALGLRTTTDENGHFSLGLIPGGQHALRVAPGWKGSTLKEKTENVIVNSASAGNPVEVQLAE
jgi:hypothetical protein